MNFNVTAELASPLESGEGDLTQSFVWLNCVKSSLAIPKSKKRLYKFKDTETKVWDKVSANGASSEPQC